MSFNGASVLCGVNGTKETTRRLHIGGGIVEEVVTSTCNDCGDLSAALEWTAWAPCANETSGRADEGMLCRRRGNTYMGFEEEERGLLQLVRATQGPIGYCPEPYVYVAGDVIGEGIRCIKRVYNFASCARHCDANSNCCSFEYSPKKHMCNLNSECQPTAKVWEDFNFCVKG